MSEDGLPPLREVIRNLGLTARKGLGQNFILDLNLTGRIARTAGDLSGKTVVEVGPGPGGLTRALLRQGARHVLAIERDRRVEPALQDIGEHYPGRLTVQFADALTVDFASCVDGPAQIVANLPYGVSAPLLVKWLSNISWPPWYDRMTLMFQREVAERIVARPGRKSYGRLSVLSQWRSEPRLLFSLSPKAFTPPPKVESALVDFIPRERPIPSCSPATLSEVTAAAFGQRRKMLRVSLKQIFDQPEVLLEELGIAPAGRAEELSVKSFCELALLLDRARKSNH